MKKFIILIIVLILIGFFAFYANEPQKDQVTIGAVLSLTGMAAVDGENIRDGIEFARIILARDGIDLNVIYEDDNTQPAQTISAINKFTTIDNVQAIIGPTWSFLASAAAQTISDKEIIAFNPANTSEHVEGYSPYYLYGAPKNSLKEEQITRWLESLEVKNVAIVIDQGTWGESHIPPFTNAIQNVGATNVLIERLPIGASGADIQTVIAKALSQNTEAILFTGFDESTALIINKVKELAPGLPILAATEIARKHNDEGVINVVLEDNVYIIAPKQSEAFREAYMQEFGEFPGPYTDTAYDGTMLLVEAITTKPENVSLNDYVRTLRYEGYMGEYSFDSKNDWQGGGWVIDQLE